MIINNQEIINLLNAFDSIAEKDLPIKITYDLFSIHSKISEVYSVYLNALERLKEKYDVKGDTFPEEMNDELLELLNIEKEIDVTPINKNTLLESGIELSLVQMQALMPVIDDGKH